MAEFKEVAKMYERLCESYDECYKCPMFTCRNENRVKSDGISCRYWALLVNPEEAEDIIMQWSSEHPIVTNGDKFKEVFGYAPYSITIFDTKFINWLQEEYKESEKDG